MDESRVDFSLKSGFTKIVPSPVFPLPYPLDVTGKFNVNIFLALMVAVVAFSLCMDVVEAEIIKS